jgi:L-asparaginase
MKVKIFTTGGSIDKGYSTKESSFVVQGPEVGNILGDANVDLDYEVEPLLRKDSLDLTEADRTVIADRVREDSCERILITHGTDTMAETGRRLGSAEGKTIVLTGAFQPASFKHTDAHFNVGFAMAAVQLLPPGVYLAMNGRLLHPDRARKNGETDRFQEAPPGV